MVSSTAATPEEYLASLPEDRRETISALRKLILKNLPAGYQESMNWGMLCYEVPLERYPNTYNNQPLGYLALAAQKNYLALYVCAYMRSDLQDVIEKGFKEQGKKIDMGKSCIRFKKLDDLPLDVIGKVVAAIPVDEYILLHEESRKK